MIRQYVKTERLNTHIPNVKLSDNVSSCITAELIFLNVLLIFFSLELFLVPSAHNSSGSGVSQSYYSDSQAIEFCRAAVSDGKIFFKHTKLLNRIGGSTKAINSSALFKRQVINQVEQMKNRQTEIHAYIYLGSMVNRNWRTE